MAIGSVSVEVVPDARGFHKKLQAELRDLQVKVGVNLDTGKAKAQLDKLATTRRSAKITAEADTKLATAKLDKLAKTRSARVRVKADVDKGSMARASSAVSKLSSDLFSLSNLVFAFGPGLIPVTAAIAGLTGALAAPLALAGVGGGIFGGITAGAIKKSTDDFKAIGQLRAMADKATDPKKAAEYTRRADKMLADLPKSERAFLKAKDSIGKGFAQLLKVSGKNIFGPLSAGAILLGKVLPRLAPITNAFGTYLIRLIGRLSKFSDSPAFRSMVNFIGNQGAKAFSQFTHIIRNTTVGIGGLISAFVPMGTSMLQVLGRATAKFRDFGEAAGSGTSKGFQNFLNYVHTVGPKVADTAGHIAVAVGHIVAALAPQGGTVLGVLDAVARTVAKMKPSQIAAVAAGIGAIGLATGKLGPVKGLTLLISGLSYANSHSKAFHTLADGAKKLAGALNDLPDVAKLLGGAALAGTVLKLRGGVGKGGVGGVVGKVLGGGVQKVFVVNMGKGGLPNGPGGPGSPDKAPGSGPAPTPVPFGKRINPAVAAGANTAGFVLIPALLDKLFGKSVSGFKTQAKTASTAASGGFTGFTAKAGMQLDKILPGKNYTEDAVKNFKKIDAALAAIDYYNPAGGARQYNALLKQSGLSAADFAKILPRASKAMKDVGQATKTAAVQTGKSLYSFSGLARATAKAGISTKETARMYRSLPKAVRTQIITPGALKSKADIKALGKQFGLTPKQVKSIVTLVGARDAIDKTAKTQKGLRKLNTTSARPKVVPQGNEATDNKLNRNIRGFRKLNGQSAKPKVKPQGTGELDAKVARNQSALRKLNASLAKPRVDVQGTAGAVTKIHSVSGALNGVPRNIPVSINIRTYGAAAAIAAAHSAAVRARQAAGLATGGPVSGPGTGTSDSIPVNLSNGEFVINAAAAHRNRALLEAINGNSVPANRHYASGGPVHSPSVVERAPSGPLYLVLENGDTLTAHLTSVAQGVNGQAKRRGDMNARAGAGRRGA